MGSWTFSQNGQAECARFVVDRGIDVDSLFSHRWALHQAPEAYQWFDRQDAGKACSSSDGPRHAYCGAA